MHLFAREYDPTLGRFISVDPIMDLTDPNQWNAYSYSNNNPATFSDPSGLKPVFDDLVRQRQIVMWLADPAVCIGGHR